MTNSHHSFLLKGREFVVYMAAPSTSANKVWFRNCDHWHAKLNKNKRKSQKAGRAMPAFVPVQDPEKARN